MSAGEVHPADVLSGAALALATAARVDAALELGGAMAERASPRGLAALPPPPRGRGPARPVVVHVMTVPLSLHFLSGQVSFMRRAGFEVHAIASPGPALDAFGEQEQIAVHGVAMTRSITPAKDLRALWRLWRELRRIRPDIVHAHTPKGGLLGLIAAALAGVRVRIYHMRGLPFVTATGARRRVLRRLEQLSCRLAHRILAISHSTRAIAVDERICRRDKIGVVRGGGNGVDADRRFVPGDVPAGAAVRARHGIPPAALVIGFVGRLAREKGVAELATAWEELRAADPRVHLLVVGAVDEPDGAPAEIVERLRADPRVHLTGMIWDMPPVYAAMDVVALPTYREGLPNVPLEAAAMALPVVATRIPGCIDAVEDGVTGTLVPARDAQALAAALARYLADPALRAAHGSAGRRRVLADFRREGIWEGVAHEYRTLLASLGAHGTPITMGEGA